MTYPFPGAINNSTTEFPPLHLIVAFFAPFNVVCTWKVIFALCHKHQQIQHAELVNNILGIYFSNLTASLFSQD